MSLGSTSAIRFIVLLGIVSLFADITYEGARSITGPYLSTLGSSAAALGVVVGIGDFIGYGVRFASGYICDKTRRYWSIVFIGYALNLLAVPLLALTSHWQTAAFLIILERFGKAIRVPSRDAMLSYASKETGRGWGFGLHESLDKIGGLLGPLVISAVLYFKGSYRNGFALLAIPAALALGVLFLANRKYPRPEEMEVHPPKLEPRGLTKKYWIYLAGIGCFALGFANFAIIAYHFQKAAAVPPIWIPIFYSLALGVDGLTSLFIGRLFDTKGISVLISATLFSSFFSPFVFYGGFYTALIGMVLWGIGMGAQDSVMRAIVATLVDPGHRGAAYGILSLAFGIFWLIGSSLMGFLYDVSLPILVIFSVAAQLASIPIFIKVKRSTL